MTEQNIRATPNKGLILEATGRNMRFLEQVHHGLNETPMHCFYPHLNLDELIVFEAGSWGFRSEKSSDFIRLVQTGDIYAVFNRINQDGFPFLQRLQKLGKWQKKHDELNPFGRNRTLKQRLERVSSEEVGRLLERLSQPANTYVFECQYADVKKARRGDNFGLEILQFMPFYPKDAETHAEKYASEIAAILRKYPAGYVPVQVQPETQITPAQPTPTRQPTRQYAKPARTRSRKISTQPELFSTYPGS